MLFPARKHTERHRGRDKNNQYLPVTSVKTLTVNKIL